MPFKLNQLATQSSASYVEDLKIPINGHALHFKFWPSYIFMIVIEYYWKWATQSQEELAQYYLWDTIIRESLRELRRS